MNNQFPSKKTVQRLREQYPEGTRIELVSMDDPYSKLKPGDKGPVSHIDDTGTIFCRWDSGSGLGLVYGADQYKKTEALAQEARRAFEYEKNTEQNYNMIDGSRNNEGSPKPDLTDGQTHAEIRELAPETLRQPEDKPSVIKQIREAQKTPKPPAKPKPGLGKGIKEPEL